jgi:hypothetical protein
MHPSNSKGEVMQKSISAVLLTIVWFGLMAHVAEIPASAEQKITPQIQNPLLDIGHIGPDAVSFHVWTDKSPEVTYKEGEQVVIHFRSGRQCFLVVAAVTLSGDVTIAYPNRKSPNNLCEAGKEYTLFGNDTGLKLITRKPMTQTALVFYVTAEQVGFVKVPDGQVVMHVASNASNALQDLHDAIKHLAGTKGFNRKVMIIKTDPACAASVESVGSKELPWTDLSEGPEPVTGTQGRTTDVEK